MAGFACAVDGALDRLGIERFDLLGYSLGARTALYLALAGGDVSRRLRRLVLESAGAGLQTPEQRASRRRADAELIALLLEAGIERFVERWESTPVLAGQRNLPDDERRRLRELRLACAADGLAASLAGMGTGAQPWLGDALASLDRPTLCLAGADDAKFAALAERLASAIPDCRVALLANCGHSPHLEDPESYFTVVDGFLAAGDDHDATLDAH
jgi:2-succinyl-6-hydroxy-2,4-cyclohexadiene-1-carboxylate synthase